MLPLHVFEPRYRRLIADCLRGDGWLAVAMLKPGWEADYEGRPPIHPVAGAGEILQAEALPDGRYNVLIDGRTRIRIEGEDEPGDLPYRIARARRVAGRERSAGDPAFADRLRGLRLAHAKLLDALGQAQPEVIGRVTVAGAGPGAMIDRIVSAVVPDAAVRQRVLETEDIEERLAIASAALADLLSMVAGAPGEDEASDG